MSSYPVSGSPVHQQPHAVPYCNDPDCEYCKQLRDVQELIRMHNLAALDTASLDTSNEDASNSGMPKNEDTPTDL